MHHYPQFGDRPKDRISEVRRDADDLAALLIALAVAAVVLILAMITR